MARPTPGNLAAIFSYFTRHRTAANLILAIFLVLGIAAIPNLRTQFFPDVVIRSITVFVDWDGAGAEDVDAGIIQVLDPALMQVDGFVGPFSTAREGQGEIVLEFEPGWDMTRAYDEVQNAVNAVTTLPEGIDDPRFVRNDWLDRVTDVVITGPVEVAQLLRHADEFTARLYAAGVSRVTVEGVDAPRILVEVPSIALIRHDITLREIADAIGAEVDTTPAGDVAGTSRIRTGTAKRSAPEIAAIVLRSNDDGSRLRVGDVATIRAEGTDREKAFFVGEDPAVTLRVERSDRGDAVAIQGIVEDVAAEMRPGLPEGVSIDLIRTRAEMISQRLSILIDNGLMGLGLVLALLFLFLNARIAFWVAAGIPVAMTAAFALMYAFGFTLNMISLFALIITLGIVVDDAIVVGEHADFRARRLGEDPVTASERAATRMFTPVFSATITTIIAFFALVAIGGRFGSLISDIPFTVIVVLAASLVECFLILPNHMAHALAHSAKEHWYDWPSRQVNKGFRWVRETLFRPLVAGVIALRYPVLAGAVLLLASQSALLIRGDVPWRFWNAPERGSVSANFLMLPGATREDTREMLRLVQASVEEVGAAYEVEYGRNPIAYSVGRIGGTAGRAPAAADTKEAELIGAISIELIDADLRPYSSWDVVSRLEEAAPTHPKLEEMTFRGDRSGPGGDALDVKISGASTATLKEAAEALKAAVAQYPEVSALGDTLAYDKEELSLELTQRGEALGYDIDTVGRTLRDLLNGIEAATFPDGVRSAEIRVELPEAERRADFIERTLVRAEGGTYVPLADIVTVETRAGFSKIRREYGVAVVTVTGDISEDDPARAAAIETALETTILPDLEERYGVTTRLAGLSEQEDAFLSDAATGLTLCLTGIYLTLAWIFASWTRPVVVMAIIPFGLVGAIYGHALWDVPFTMFSVVGLLGMVGIIINDSIVLVGTIDEKAAERGLVPAIVEGAADRLRPVLLTTLTTVLGLAPLLYETSQQAQFLKPTVITLVYGLGFGLVLVLLVVPALLAAQEDVAQAFRSMRRAFGGRSRALAGGLAGLAAALAALFAVTLGPVLVGRGLPGPLGALLPGAMEATPALAFAFFAAGALALTLVAGFGMAWFGRRSRP